MAARLQDVLAPYFLRRIVMKTLITALAVTAILATSAVAKTQRTKEARIQPNNSLSHNSVSRNPVARLNASYCQFQHGETDPDPRIRLQLVRDCRERVRMTPVSGFCKIGSLRTGNSRGAVIDHAAIFLSIPRCF